MSFLHYVRNVDKVTKNVLKKDLTEDLATALLMVKVFCVVRY